MALSEKILNRQSIVLVDILREVCACVEKGYPADSTLASIYRRHREFGSRDRRLFSDTVFSYFRWKGWLDTIAARDLRAATVFAHLLDTHECHPTIRFLAASLGIPPSSLRPLGPLPLASKQSFFHAQLTAWDTTMPPPSITQLVPNWFYDVAENQQNIDRLIEAFQSAPPTWLRLRPSSSVKVVEILHESGIEPVTHPHVTDCVAVPRGANLQGLAPRFRSGMEIQDLASLAVGLVCAPTQGESWWDACAGSGGKTLHLADLLGSTGKILATDVRPGALDELHRRAENDALTSIIRTRAWDGLKEPAPIGPFDGVLLDAPCSGMGTWHRNPDARWRISGMQIAHLAELQLTLLRACATRVRPGGKLIYATCTLTHAENGGVIESFLKENPDFSLQPFLHPLTGTKANGSLYIHPWDGPCNGMFMARLTRG
jgi:16S rRNA (cytosine967-C5)-methyltransferase